MSIFDPANCIIPTVVSLMFANMHLAIDTVKVIPFSNPELTFPDLHAVLFSSHNISSARQILLVDTRQ